MDEQNKKKLQENLAESADLADSALEQVAGGTVQPAPGLPPKLKSPSGQFYALPEKEDEVIV